MEKRARGPYITVRGGGGGPERLSNSAMDTQPPGVRARAHHVVLASVRVMESSLSPEERH